MQPLDLSIKLKVEMMPIFHSILQFFARNRDRLWQLSYIVVITFFLAKSINVLLTYNFFPFDLPPIAKNSTGSVSASNARQVNINAIVSRNIFNSEVKGPYKPGQAVLDGEPVPSTLNVELLGTIVFRNSRFSVGLVRDRSTNKAEYYGVGEPLQSAIVSKVERFRVILENGGRLEFIELKAAENKISGKASFGSPAPSMGGGGINAELEEIGPNRYLVPQTLLDETMGNFSKVLTQARMVPNLTDDNRTDGFKVFQIKPDSIYQKLGLKDQDIIKRVNGQDLDSFEKATGLFSALRNEKTISIDIVRNGVRINYTYEIR